MPCRAILIAVALSIVWLPSAPAQQVPVPVNQLGLPLSQYWSVQYSVTSGRLLISSKRFAGSTETESSTGGTSGVRREHQMLKITRGQVTLHYDLTTADEQFNLAIDDSERIHLQHGPGPKGEGTHIDFTQLPHQPLTLTIREKDAQRTITGATLWHLLLAEPQVCREQLTPLIERLRPGWRLAATAAGIEQTLLRMARQPRAADKRQWAEWVAQLGDEQFSQREAAEHKLQGMGPAIVPFLKGLDNEKLDPEQRQRVRNVLSGFEDGSDDTPERVVMELMGDPSIWLSLATRSDATTRQTAAAQLKQILGDKIEFDPAADEATRQRQIAALRQTVERAEAKPAPAEADPKPQP